MLSLLENSHHRWSATSRVGEDRLRPDRPDLPSADQLRGLRAGRAGVVLPGSIAWKWPCRILGAIIAWLAQSWARSEATPPRLAVMERLALSPKHSLLLVEADGVGLLISTSTEAPSTMFLLHGAQAGRSISDHFLKQRGRTTTTNAVHRSCDGAGRTVVMRKVSSQVPADGAAQTELPVRLHGSRVARSQGESRISW